ncbi:hypothetical protein [Mucilaginibacter defluvii]|uniref:Uncharacterized protein n=1 Tax=Mucilaginibacter defluvii TaxID=1196019 RepID=A0ABP9FK52_9SPHI
MTPKNEYPGLLYKADELYKFKQTLELFSIMLKEGFENRIIHFEPAAPDDFRVWLMSHKIIDIGPEDPKSIM